MSSTPLLQCLFCNHLNPGGASFCNDCGSPLHLRPCGRCGAIDKRDAEACYKCGEEFSLSAMLEIVAQPGANEIRAESATPGYNLALAPTILDNRRALSALNDDDITSGRTSLPESAAVILSELSQGFRPGSNENLAEVVGAVVPKAVFRNDDPVHISGGLLHSDEKGSTGRAATLTGSQRLRRVAVSVALLAALAFSVYYYHEQSTQLAGNQNVKQLSPPLSGAATIVRPLPANDADMKPRQEPPIIKECSEAVAALGLCSPGTKQEK